ncbi:cytochrome c oxidase subunit II [Aquibaculum sediminis]|uniref:cytochrome c oxidase subunit II n=1 Tax=Aquibaculum sediminis TaxID=3231907 RepID=UPI00345132F6
MMRLMSRLGAALVALVSAVSAAPVLAQEIIGEPRNWGLGFQPSVTPIKDQMHDFHNLLLIIITAITLFVLALLVFVILRFREDANKTPSKTTHNTLIEIVWTTVPVLILVIIAVPSFRLLYASDRVPESAITIKATGMQWYWNYEYDHPDQGTFQFDSFMLTDEEAAEAGLPRLLGVDQEIVVPTDTNIRVVVTAGDVLHSFAVPSFGVKVDAVPGRLNEIWFNVNTPGLYFGQCSELCGTGHAYMPIQVRAVPRDEYDAWLDEMAEQYAEAPATAPARATQLADARSAQ